MQLRNVRWARSVVLGVFVAGATLAATASAAFAWSYTANITPGSVLAGSSTQFNVALTNTSGDNPLGSAIITPPRKFTLVSASLGTQTGSLTLDPKKVVLKGLGLAPGQTVNVSVTAAAPTRCKTYNWHTAAYSKGLASQQLDFDSADSSVSTTVTCTSATGLEFLTQPSDSLVNQDINPAVQVEVVDSGGNQVTNYTGSVTLALGTDTAADSDGATLGGTTTEPVVGGVATFSDLTLDRSDNYYTLVASSPGLTSTESSQFNIYDGETACNTAMDCLLTLNGPTSTFSIDAGPNNGDVTGQVDPGTPMDGPGSNPDADPGCAGYTPQNPDWYGFDVINQVDESGPPAKTLTGTFKDATPDGYQICFGSTSTFLTVSGGDVTRAPAGTLPDGTRGFVGFLPFCDQLDGQAVPCITDDPLTTQPDRSSTTGEDVIVDVSIPANFPGDPFMGRG